MTYFQARKEQLIIPPWMPRSGIADISELLTPGRIVRVAAPDPALVRERELLWENT